MDFAEGSNYIGKRSSTSTAKASWKLKLEVLIWQFVAFCMTYLYKLFPQTNGLRTDLIPFRPDIQISLESHAYYACERLRWVIVSYLFYSLSEHYKPQLKFFFILSL